MKTINYCGMTFEVEDRFKYVATDSNGDIWVYEIEPEVCDDHWMSSDGCYKKLITINNWEDSLENI